MTKLLQAVLVMAFLGHLTAAGLARSPDDAKAAPRQAAASEAQKPPGDQASEHSIELNGQKLTYTATAGTLPLTDDKGETTAHVFYTSYALPGSGEPRPVSFVFNGGPGAASAFLHLGAIGPRAVPFNDNGSAPLQPVRLVDNPDTWLPFTDLVFVDPVATGYSRAVGGSDVAKDKFFGVDKDADAMSAFVRLYLTRTGRILDPVFLVGESYGGFRAALLTKRLLRAGLDVRGAVLVSPVIEFSLIRGDDLTLLPIAVNLPSIAASHFERQGSGALDLKLIDEVESFALGPYLGHLAAGIQDAPDVYARLARYTGLSPEDVGRHHGRITVSHFRSEYLRAKDRVLSLYDGSVSIPTARPAARHNPDPILDYAVAALTPAFVRYARDELGYKTDLDYHLLNHEVSGHWDYGTRPQRQGYAGALDDLQAARVQHPELKVLIAAGYTDLVTPYAASRFLIRQMEPIEGAAPVQLKVYPGGHMLYLRAASRKDLAADARAVYAAATLQK